MFTNEKEYILLIIINTKTIFKKSENDFKIQIGKIISFSIQKLLFYRTIGDIFNGHGNVYFCV